MRESCVRKLRRAACKASYSEIAVARQRVVLVEGIGNFYLQAVGLVFEAVLGTRSWNFNGPWNANFEAAKARDRGHIVVVGFDGRRRWQLEVQCINVRLLGRVFELIVCGCAVGLTSFSGWILEVNKHVVEELAILSLEVVEFEHGVVEVLVCVHEVVRGWRLAQFFSRSNSSAQLQHLEWARATVSCS